MGETDELLIGFSEIGEDVDSLVFGGLLIVKNNDLISYGLMINPMRGKIDQYLKVWLKKLGGLGSMSPRIFSEILIANAAFWINLKHQIKAEIAPIFYNICHSSPATYFILVIYNMLDCFCTDAETRRGPIEGGGGGSAPKRGGGPDPMDSPGHALE